MKTHLSKTKYWYLFSQEVHKFVQLRNFIRNTRLHKRSLYRLTWLRTYR